jgi:hypothetical protein
MESTYVALERQFNNIQIYPAFKLARLVAVACVGPIPVSAALISAQALTMEERTMSPKERRARAVTEPPNQRTSP